MNKRIQKKKRVGKFEMAAEEFHLVLKLTDQKRDMDFVDAALEACPEISFGFWAPGPKESFVALAPTLASEKSLDAGDRFVKWLTGRPEVERIIERKWTNPWREEASSTSTGRNSLGE